ncbi:MAG: hypothetical protein WB992_19035 [Bryobacteraceae bacterium]
MSDFAEALKPSPEEAVLRWLTQQNRHVVVTPAITEAGILYEVELLPSRAAERTITD